MTSAGLHRLDIGEETVEFSDRGNGEAVLLIHAGVFAAWFPAVSQDPALRAFRRVGPTRAGYDSTAPAPTRHLTLADHASHWAAVLESLGVEQAHVLAHSSGSLIGLQLALDRPGLVRSLVLVEPAAAPCLLSPAAAADFGQFVRSVAATVAAGDLATAFDTFMRRVCAEDYRTVLVEALGPGGLEQAERDCGFFFRDEGPAVREWSFGASDASRIAQPVLLVQGGASPPLVHGVVAGLAEMLPSAEITTAPGADHLLPLRDPATLATIAAGFMERHPTRAKA
ncbi:alpha/beta hydrolase [Pseudonocardia sp. RS11V-5]|uniref:alpha/beta fold hydrolase n=1 Tax=Pseudonocardia terrae TaxID=2905831 RepID=UPI001E2C8636|nr:alpha/beta hydrolase [Pseudonocardia terrae]MCE3556400.1 alpha/beta hydrolase [Pseudonocardia terrae]